MLSTSDFNCTKFPGICKPTNTSTLAKVQEAQRQFNRLADIKGLKKIAIDGDVGPGTLALAQKVLGAGPLTATVAALAVSIDQAGPLAKELADRAGAPVAVSSPQPAKPPTIITPTGQEMPVSAASVGILGSMSSTQKLILAGIAGLVIYKTFIAKKKRRR